MERQWGWKSNGNDSMCCASVSYIVFMLYKWANMSVNSHTHRIQPVDTRRVDKWARRRKYLVVDRVSIYQPVYPVRVCVCEFILVLAQHRHNRNFHGAQAAIRRTPQAWHGNRTLYTHRPPPPVLHHTIHIYRECPEL